MASFADRGAAALRPLRERIAGRRFDRALGVRTSARDAAALACDADRYEPAAPDRLRRAAAALRPGPGDTVLDIGSGLGRAVFALARRGRMSAAIGFEKDPGLHVGALANLSAARPRLRCPDIRLFCADAARTPVPAEVTAVYLYNPIEGPEMEEVFARIRESLDRRPREMRIAYEYPVHGFGLVRLGFRRTAVAEALHLYTWPGAPAAASSSVSDPSTGPRSVGGPELNGEWGPDRAAGPGPVP
ncbi:class I SAM-dependent methyltransferase [Nocardiopsis potens]|uniref:class I SAM-dependent methyltransferase n=1 Tax=Nocardiopsis potens TaxID=1246458 RepID=UPI000382B478|nr:class I SAM-dependent methyltransferase [Nocardiopsis potens]